MSLPALLRRAAADEKLSALAYRVLSLAYPDLDPVGFRDLKAGPIAKNLVCHRSAVDRGLAQLVRRGYLECEKRGRGQVGSYRLASGGGTLIRLS